MLHHSLRKANNALVRCLPRPLLRAFLKSFETVQDVAEASGYNVYPRAFYSPIPQVNEVNWDGLRSRRDLPGIELRLDNARELLRQLHAFVGELDYYPQTQTPGKAFWFQNQSFTDFDAAVLYTFLRWRKPKRYIELGCGHSSLVSSEALKRNIQEGNPCEAVYADPEPRLDVRIHLDFARLILQPVQQLPLDLFRDLEPGDVLFIDTSHVLKLQSDVEFELLHILPVLKPGVWIHFHDVFTPYDYPEEWVRSPIRLGANEQYAVECLLSGGDRYEIELPLFCLWKEQNAALQDVFPAGNSRPHSFWIRKVRK